MQGAWKHNRYKIFYTTFTFVRIQFAKWCPHHGWYEDYHNHNYADNDWSPSKGIDHDLTLHLTDISNRSRRRKLERKVQTLYKDDKLDIKCAFYSFILQFVFQISNFPLSRKAISKCLPAITHVARNDVTFQNHSQCVGVTNIYIIRLLFLTESQNDLLHVINNGVNITSSEASKTTRAKNPCTKIQRADTPEFE